MFTGIIQAKGRVVLNSGSALAVSPDWSEEDIQSGESISVNGVCLTVLGLSNPLTFDLSPETLERTTLGALAPGQKVNLERALRVGDRLGGHFVQGHVDAVGSIKARREAENSQVLTFEVPEGFERYLVDKGSVCVDGISLTVVEPRGRLFDIWIVPHTLRETNLDAMRAGSQVNLEFDMLAKYVEKLIRNSP
ncbi:MAG: riboflavin synthase [Fimbriimonadaceae bacterium]